MSGRSPSPPLNRRSRHLRSMLPTNRKSKIKSNPQHRLPQYARSSNYAAHRQSPAVDDQQQNGPENVNATDDGAGSAGTAGAAQPAVNLFLHDSDDADSSNNFDEDYDDDNDDGTRLPPPRDDDRIDDDGGGGGVGDELDDAVDEEPLVAINQPERRPQPIDKLIQRHETSTVPPTDGCGSGTATDVYVAGIYGSVGTIPSGYGSGSAIVGYGSATGGAAGTVSGARDMEEEEVEDPEEDARMPVVSSFEEEGPADGRPSSSGRFRRNDFKDPINRQHSANLPPSLLVANAFPNASGGGSGVGASSSTLTTGATYRSTAAAGHPPSFGAAMSSALSSRPPNVGANAAGGGNVSGNPLHNWQSTKHTLKERFSFMFCNEILADVHFVVGRGEQRIPAHKFVLSVGSAVFDAMFNGAMATPNQDDIELPDVEPSAFLALLKFLYSDDFQIGPESVMTTLYTAKKYAVPALEYACVDFLKRNLNSDNAFMLLTQARLFDEPTLAKLCLEMIDKHTMEALNAEGFTDIDLDTMSAVMERDTLRIREVSLFQAVVRWSVEECHRRQFPVTSENQRQVLGRALHLIRFPLMTVEEFAQTAAQGGILSDREVVNLFLFFTVNPKPSVGFLDVPRCCVTGKEQVVNRFQKIEGRWGYSGTPDRIKFNVDRRIFVVGFGLYGSIHGPSEYQVTIQIIHCGSGKALATNDTSFQCDGSLNTFRVLFKEPVEISPSVTYIASACLKGVDSHYGAKGVRRIVHQSSGGCSITFQFTYAAGNNNGTSVEDGQIPEIIFYTKISS